MVAAAGGTVDCLVNNAGIMDEFLNAHEMDDDVWERVLSVNVTAVMRMTRAVLPGMLEAGRGNIVNVGSVAGLSGMAGGTAYITSKHALVGFTRSCAVLYTPKGIRVNLVAPGAVKTNIEAPFASQFTAERLGPLMQAVVPPPAEPEQLAAAITWLLSDDSTNVSGVILPSDGGWLAL